MHPYLVGLLEMVRTHAWGKSNYFSRIVEVNGQVHEQVIYFVAAGNTIRIYGHDISEYKQAQDLLQEPVTISIISLIMLMPDYRLGYPLPHLPF